MPAHLNSQQYRRLHETSIRKFHALLSRWLYLGQFWPVNTLFLKSPHLRSHIFSIHIVGVPVEIHHIAAASVSGPRDASASAHCLNVGAGQMFRFKDVTSSNIPLVRICDYCPPPSVLIVGKINSRSGSLTVSHLTEPGPIILGVRPAVDDIANGLFLVRIAGTTKYFDVAVIVIYGLL